MTGASQHQLAANLSVQPQSGLNLTVVLSAGHETEVEDDDSYTVMMPRRGVI